MKKWFLIVAIGISLLVFAVLVKCTAANAHPIYDQNGYVIGETLENHYYPPEMVQPLDRSPRITPEDLRSEDLSKEEILSLLRECLEFIEDGSDYWPTYGTHTLEVRSLPGTISQKEQEIKDAQAELDRLKRETALNKKIKQIIEQLQK